MGLSKNISSGQEQQEHQRRWRCCRTAFWDFTIGFLVVFLLFGSLQVSVRASYDAYVQTIVDKDLEAAPERSKSRAERNDRTEIGSTEATNHHAKGQAVVPKAVPYLNEMKEHHTTRSLQHQQKFFAVKDRVLAWAKKKDNKELRNHPTVTPLVRSASTGKFFAYNLNPNFAFLHVFKSGGTTVERQLGRKRHNTLRQVGNRTLIVSVRDPIDHFLSGWGECGERFPKQLLATNQQNRRNRRFEAEGSYDDRVRSWLSFVQNNCTEGGWSLCTCKAHSLPQADFLISHEREFFPTLGVVGDLHELPGLLELAGVSFDHSISNGRDARSSKIKRQHFFKDLGRLSNRTLQDICRFVALDYHYFDFEPPPPCRDELLSDWAADAAVS